MLHHAKSNLFIKFCPSTHILFWDWVFWSHRHVSPHLFNILCDQLGGWSPMKHFYILEKYKCLKKNGCATIWTVRWLNYPFNEEFYLTEWLINWIFRRLYGRHFLIKNEGSAPVTSTNQQKVAHTKDNIQAFRLKRALQVSNILSVLLKLVMLLIKCD